MLLPLRGAQRLSVTGAVLDQPQPARVHTLDLRQMHGTPDAARITASPGAASLTVTTGCKLCHNITPQTSVVGGIGCADLRHPLGLPLKLTAAARRHPPPRAAQAWCTGHLCTSLASWTPGESAVWGGPVWRPASPIFLRVHKFDVCGWFLRSSSVGLAQEGCLPCSHENVHGVGLCEID